ncbi:hypothetical protein AVEN_256535-1 [Araneus ventricosus]|uniref:Uncharacterized protein n=1 Tax=Araneus ventricosus TaxID=182803 RepID=A0A4Y2S0F2_ARAVE|nr:hypothetical protein AVEN_256535-1 [Araneus ventricosus]
MSGVKRNRNVLNVKQKLEILEKLDNGKSANIDAEDALNEGNTIFHSAALQSVETLLDYMGQRGFDYGDITAIIPFWSLRVHRQFRFDILTSRFEASRVLFWDGPHSFESWLDEEDDAWARLLSPNFRTKPMGGRLIQDVRFSMHLAHIREESLMESRIEPVNLSS